MPASLLDSALATTSQMELFGLYVTSACVQEEAVDHHSVTVTRPWCGAQLWILWRFRTSARWRSPVWVASRVLHNLAAAFVLSTVYW